MNTPTTTANIPTATFDTASATVFHIWRRPGPESGLRNNCMALNHFYCRALTHWYCMGCCQYRGFRKVFDAFTLPHPHPFVFFLRIDPDYIYLIS
jgi:hypothetical protein